MNVTDAAAEMQAMGLVVDQLVCDGQIHRVQIDGKRASNRSGSYCLRELLLKSGMSVVVGFAHNFVTDEMRTFSVSDSTGMTDTEFAMARGQLVEAKKQAEQERKLAAENAAKRAEEIWSKLPDSGKAPYLFNKGVRGYGLRYARDSVVVPLRDIEGTWRGLQFIYPDGTKRFITGTKKKGAFHLIGQPDKWVFIAEGYATAATVYDATGTPTAVAFDAGNLLPVAKAFRSKYPAMKIVICGDDDKETPGNPGREKAISAAMAVGGRAVFPVF